MLNALRFQRGVTMIEIAVVMTLMAVLLFTVLPSVTAAVANQRTRSSAESLMQGLMRARAEALKANRPVSLWLTTTTASGDLDNGCALAASARAWVVSINDPAGKCAAANSLTTDPMILERAVAGSTAANVTVAALQSDGATAANSVTFDGFGRVTAATAISTIDLDHASPGNDYRPLRIEVGRGGSVRLCEPRVTNTDDPRRC
jgi:type IV fimbrial biogenesis protein FimT